MNSEVEVEINEIEVAINEIINKKTFEIKDHLCIFLQVPPRKGELIELNEEYFEVVLVSQNTSTFDIYVEKVNSIKDFYLKNTI